jgi:predicted O-methyltransferase YrrM
VTAFERIEWRADRMLLGDLVFRLQGRANDDWELGEECLVFYKGKRLVDQYAAFFASHPDQRTDNLLELGIFGGGSMAFWLECLRPRKHVGIDIKDQTDTAYFRRFVAERAAGGRLKTYWGTSQDDVPALLRIVRQEFDGPLDLVIDDASHFYEPTLASFEALFPLVRPGGLYIIEDWAWAHWREVDLTSTKFLDRAAQLTNLVAELVAATGTDRGLITRLEVRHGFTVVERGPGPLASGTFRLADHVYRRPGQARRDLLTRLRRAGRELFGPRARR